MSINSLETATRYSQELDKLFSQKSATGFFADNTFGKKFVGAKTVIIPDVNFQGLADYNRDTGFTRGAITVSNTSYTMQMDRARSLQIDREDMDETGIANLAGKILGEYVRTKVVPECDAYVISKLAGLAATRSNILSGDVSKPFETLLALIKEVQSVVGYDEELVAFVDGGIYALLQNTPEISRQIIVSDFKQGDISLRVNSINGVALIPVVSERMRTAYEFRAGEAGGFVPATNSKAVYMMVCPKKGAHLVRKTEKMRIFTPEQNVDADAFKFDYRIYYDVFVKKSGLDAIWAWLSPEVSISLADEDITVTEGAIGESITVTAECEDGTVTYQWYSAADASGNDAIKVKGATSQALKLDEALTKGKYYYFVRVIVNGISAVQSDVITVTVE